MATISFLSVIQKSVKLSENSQNVMENIMNKKIQIIWVIIEKYRLLTLEG